MADTVLVPFDGSEQAERALDHAIEHFPDATVVLLSVINPAEFTYAGGEETLSPLPDDWYERAHESTDRALEQAAEHVRAAGGTVETAIELGRPARAIVNYVEANDLDHIVMGSHGRSGVSRVLLGSVAEAVVRRAPVPVTVVKTHEATA